MPWLIRPFCWVPSHPNAQPAHRSPQILKHLPRLCSYCIPAFAHSLLPSTVAVASILTVNAFRSVLPLNRNTRTCGNGVRSPFNNPRRPPPRALGRVKVARSLLALHTIHVILRRCLIWSTQ